MLNRKLFNAVLLAAFLFLTSCEYETIVYPDIDLNKTMGFSQDIIPIFKTSCIACHNNDSNPPVLLESSAFLALTSGGYLNVKDPVSSVLMQRVNSNHPDNETPTKNQKSMLLNWIIQGALNN